MAKRFIGIMLICAVLSASFAVYSIEEAKTRFYVSENGADTGDGTFENPFKTIFKARDAVRELNAAGLLNDVEVIVRGGVYIMPEVWRMGPEDSGTNGHSITWKGYENEYPLISAGIKINGFSETENGMWKTTVPEAETMMEMYVNDTRVYRAAMEYEVFGLGDYNDPETAYPYDGIYMSKKVLDGIAHPEDLVLRAARAWKGLCGRAAGLIEDPEDSTRNILLMNEWWTSLRGGSRWSHGANPYYGFRIENAFEFLDKPGEYYFDKRTKELWYMPREGEKIDTVEAYAPNLQYALLVKGKNGELVKNLNFEGLRFAHASYLSPEYNGYTHGQASETFFSRSFEELDTPAGVTVWFADNIHFKNCVVFGMAADGITMGISVSNSSVEGCAVYDLGGSGLTAGHSAQYGYGPNNNFNRIVDYLNPERFDMFYHSYRSVSDVGPMSTGYCLNENESPFWNPYNDVNTNTKSWLKFKFDESVSLDEIVLAPGKSGEDAARSNFEIIVSNDPDFNEFTTLYSQGSTPYTGDRLSVKVSDTTKYEYLMVRKTKVEPFSLNYIHMYTNDLKPDQLFLSNNISFKNNYITRTCNYYYGNIGILAYDVENFEAVNNEIYKTTYSGMSIGWSPYSFTESMLIKDNFIHDYMYKSQDGGGIYTLGVQHDAEITGNHIKNMVKHNGGIYNDLNSVGFNMHDNVMEYVPNNFWSGLTGDRNIVARNIYSTTNRQLFLTAKDGAPTSFIDPIIPITEDNLTPEAQEIVKNAGISKDYLWVKDMVPDNKTYYEDDRIGWYLPHWGMAGEYDAGENIIRPSYLSSGKEMVDMALEYVDSGNTLLDNNRIGELPGQYDAEAVFNLKDAMDDIGVIERESDNNKVGQTERYLKYMDAYNACLGAYNRLTLSETLKAADNLLESTEAGTGEGMAAKASIDKFRRSLDAIRANSGGADEYALIREAEAAITEFDDSILKAEIKGFKLSNIDGRTVIDKNRCKVTVYVTPDVDVSSVSAFIEVSAGSTAYPDFSEKHNFNYPVEAVLQRGGLQKVWTIEVVREDRDRWYNYLDTPVDGLNATLPSSMFPYVYEGGKKNNIDINLYMDKADNDKGTSILFDAPKVQMLRDGIAADNSHYEFTIFKDYLELSHWSGGKREIIFGSPYDKDRINKEIFKTSDYMNLKETNNVNIVTRQVGESKNITVRVNGNLIFNGLCASETDSNGGYMGINSFLANVKVGAGRSYNVALNKWSYSNAGPIGSLQNIIDGDVSTSWVSDTSKILDGNMGTTTKLVIIDLLKPYVLDNINLFFDSAIAEDARTSFNILLANTYNNPGTHIGVSGFSDAVLLDNYGDLQYAKDGWNSIPVDKETAYRYIMFNKLDTGYEKPLAFSEIQVMSSDTDADLLELTRKASCIAGPANKKDALDGDLMSTATYNDVFPESPVTALTLDLGASVPVSQFSYRHMIVSGTSDTLGVNICFANKPDFTDQVVIPVSAAIPVVTQSVSGSYRYVKFEYTTTSTGQSVVLFDFGLLGQAPPKLYNVALNKWIWSNNTQVSSVAAIDGDTNTGYTFQSDGEWLLIDLLKPYTLSEVKITWGDECRIPWYFGGGNQLNAPSYNDLPDYTALDGGNGNQLAPTSNVQIIPITNSTKVRYLRLGSQGEALDIKEIEIMSRDEDANLIALARGNSGTPTEVFDGNLLHTLVYNPLPLDTEVTMGTLDLGGLYRIKQVNIFLIYPNSNPNALVYALLSKNADFSDATRINATVGADKAIELANSSNYETFRYVKFMINSPANSDFLFLEADVLGTNAPYDGILLSDTNSNPLSSIPANGSMTISFNAENSTASDNEYTVFVVEYDADDKITHISMNPVDIPQNSLLTEYYVPSIIHGDTSKVRVFVWEMNEMKPVYVSAMLP